MVYVDSEGLADGRSMINTVLNLAPKSLIVAGGSRRAKTALVSQVRKQLDGDNNRKSSSGSQQRGGAEGAEAGGGEVDAFTRYAIVQKAMEPVPVALDSGACDVLLHDSLHTQLKWKQVNGREGSRARRGGGEGGVRKGVSGGLLLFDWLTFFCLFVGLAVLEVLALQQYAEL